MNISFKNSGKLVSILAIPFFLFAACDASRGKLTQTSLNAMVVKPDGHHYPVSTIVKMDQDSGYATSESVASKYTYRIDLFQNPTQKINTLDLTIISPDHVTTVATAMFTLSQDVFEAGSSATIDCFPNSKHSVCKLEDFTAFQYRYPGDATTPGIQSCRIEYKIDAKFKWSDENNQDGGKSAQLSTAYSSTQAPFRMSVTCKADGTAGSTKGQVVFKSNFEQK